MKRRIFYSIMLVCLLCSSILFISPIKAGAEATDVYQVNGKYTITTKKLTTYGALATAVNDYPAKKRTYQITSKTKFQIENDDFVKKTVSKAKAKQLIKKWNKSNVTLQFKKKGNRITHIWAI